MFGLGFLNCINSTVCVSYQWQKQSQDFKLSCYTVTILRVAIAGRYKPSIPGASCGSGRLHAQRLCSARPTESPGTLIHWWSFSMSLGCPAMCQQKPGKELFSLSKGVGHIWWYGGMKNRFKNFWNVMLSTLMDIKCLKYLLMCFHKESYF